MRLSEDTIKQGIVHPNLDVRDTATMYFSRSACRDESILPFAIQAIEECGCQNAFSVATVIDGLPISDETLPWVITELQENDFKGDIFWQEAFTRLVRDANVGLLARHRARVLAIDALNEDDRAWIKMRIELLDMDEETCWRELDAVCLSASQEGAEADTKVGYALVEAIARHGNSERALSAVSKKIDKLNDRGEAWMELFMVSLAGEMREDGAVPSIVAKIKEADDYDDYLFEGAERALIDIGTDVAVEGAASLFSVDDSRCISACQVLQHVHSDLAVAKGMERLVKENDEATNAWLADALINQFASEVIEPVRQIVLEGRYDKTVVDLRRGLIVAATLLEIDLPESEQWRADIEKRYAERKTRLLPEPPLEAHDDEYENQSPLERTKVGRNEPCPCGSGKKYKKCCMRKQQGAALFDG